MTKEIKTLEMIMADMEADVAKFDGRPLTGKTVAEIHGTLAATIQALARIMRDHLQEHELEKDKA